MQDAELNDIEKEIAERKAAENSLVKQPEVKSITEISANDIKVQIDNNKSMEAQAEDIVGAMATAKAVQNEETAQDLAFKKAEELKAKATAKQKAAETAQIKADTEKQEAEREKHEAVLQTFGINKHLPDWLLTIMLIPFTPLYIIISLVVGVPCGIIKVIIDNIDNILVRYESAAEKNKPKIKVTVWLVLIAAAVGVILYAVFKILGKL